MIARHCIPLLCQPSCGPTCPQECPLSSILTSIWPKMSHKCTLCSLQQHKYLLNFWHSCFFLKLSNSLNCSQNKRFSLSRKGQNNLMGFSKSGLGTVIVTKCFPSYRQMLSLRKHISDINCTQFFLIVFKWNLKLFMQADIKKHFMKFDSLAAGPLLGPRSIVGFESSSRSNKWQTYGKT